MTTCRGSRVNYDKFIEQVQRRAGFGSSGEAVAATGATLDVLGRCIFGSTAHELAEQLPSQLALFLGQPQTGERLGVREFYKRVSDQEGVDVLDACLHVGAVFSVMREAVPRRTIEKIREQLPDEYDPLFETGGEDASSQPSSR